MNDSGWDDAPAPTWPLERAIYRLTGVDASREMRWTEYAMAMLAFSIASFVALYLISQGLDEFANPRLRQRTS